MPEIQYCKGENMTQKERQVHMKYVLKQLETRNDVVMYRIRTLQNLL